MKVSETAIAPVVAEASERMHDSKYISGQVDKLMSAQPHITQYVVAHQQDLSMDGIVLVLFYGALIQRSVAEALGRRPGVVSYAMLDAAATATPTIEAFAEEEGDLASFIAGNVDLGGEAATKLAIRLLTHVAGALVGA